jgi:hypothetical protein
MARTTLPPQTSCKDAIVVPAMIETTSVEPPAKAFSVAPASRKVCGFSATTSVSAAPMSFGLSRMPLATSPKISADGAGSITTTRLGSRPCASQPVSIAPPILPAPARTMVPVMFFRALLFTGVTTITAVVPAKAGTHNHRRF